MEFSAEAFNHLLLTTTFMMILGVVLAIILSFANKRLYVYEDPRIDDVEELLPHANCGACGSPGCRPFAEALVAKKVDPGLCTVNESGLNQEIADYLGVEVEQREKVVARLACAGGSHVAHTRANYKGLKTCRAAALVSGGGKGCSWACLGLEDCGTVCDFDAISFNKFNLPVVNESLCTACGDCVAECPKDLFSLQPISHKLWVACNNKANMDESEAHCEVACNACSRCVSDAPEGLITIKSSLATIDYTKNGLASTIPIDRCPTGAIVWKDFNTESLKGSESKKIIRKEPIRTEPLPRV